MQSDHASVAVAEDPRDRALRSEAGEAVRPLKAQTASGSGHAATLSRSGAPSGPFPAAPRAGGSPITRPISPTHFHEEPNLKARGEPSRRATPARESRLIAGARGSHLDRRAALGGGATSVASHAALDGVFWILFDQELRGLHGALDSLLRDRGTAAKLSDWLGKLFGGQHGVYDRGLAAGRPVKSERARPQPILADVVVAAQQRVTREIG